MSDEFETDVEETDAPEQEEHAEAPEPTPEEPAPVKDWTDEEEEEARAFNWKAPEEWAGEKPPGYIDNPKDYMARIQRSSPFRVMNERLEKQAAEAAEINRKLAHATKAMMERQRSDYEARLEQVRSNRDRAAEEGDLDAYRRNADAEQELLKQQPVQATPEPVQDTRATAARAEVDAYGQTTEGQWLQNPILRQTGAQLIGANPAIMAKPPLEQIKYAEAEVRKMYPAYFPQPETPKPASARTTVDSGGLASTRAGGGAFAKLPSDAKEAFRGFVADGLFEDTNKEREEYARDYNNG